MPNSFRSPFRRGGPPSSAAAAPPPAPAIAAASQAVMLQRVIDAIEALVVIVSPDCSLWLWNRRCGETSGVPPSEAMGRPFWSVMRLRSNLRAEAQQAFERLLAGDVRSVDFRSQWLRKDGRRARVSWTARLVDWGGGFRFVVATGSETSGGTVEDITERKALETQLKETSEMEALGRLAGGVAHDFNNLLTAINGYADLLVDSLEGDERAADAVELRKAGLRAAELTAQLLAFARRGKGALEPVDLNVRIEAMMPMLRRLLGVDIELTATLDKTLGPVLADPSQLDQVVVNLVVNGRDAMPAGGSLSLTTVRGRTSSGLSGPVARDGDEAWARLDIADTGHGMEPEVLEHIFEPFLTTKGKTKGTGLGLATVYGIVRQMNGYIRVESTVGVGSRFMIELPMSDAPSTPPSADGDELAPAVRSNDSAN